MKLLARFQGEEIPVIVERYGSGYQVRLRDRVLIADMITAGDSMRALRFEDGRQEIFLFHREQGDYRITVAGRKVVVEVKDPLTARRLRGPAGASAESVIKALMPGRVVRLSVAPGDEVVRGQGILILEAMKMENEITAPRDGRIALVHVEAGSTVDGGAPLVTFE
ncbi:MAG: biotin/lipoyl-containing protein [Thermoanaerobaculia bacterium]